MGYRKNSTPTSNRGSEDLYLPSTAVHSFDGTLKISFVKDDLFRKSGTERGYSLIITGRC